MIIGLSLFLSLLIGDHLLSSIVGINDNKLITWFLIADY